MKIDLKPHQESYLCSLVATGAYASLEDALDALISSAQQDDAWMRAYVDEAITEVAAGQVSPWSADDLRAELHRRHPELKNGADR